MSDLTLLLVNKFYHDSGPAGGVGRYVLQEEEDLAAAGWQVVPFAMRDAEARPSRWSGYFVRARDYSRPRWSRATPGDSLNLLWNREAARNLEALLQEVRPGVAHLHNIYHHLSPSILPVLARHGVPAVMTLHDLRLLCPAIHMLRHGEVCERCRGGRFYEAVLGRCVKGSAAASLLAALETAHQHLRGLYRDGVVRFICPSRFYLERFADWGYPRERLLHLPNFVDTDYWTPGEEEPRAEYIYFGRISAEKGLGTLLQAQARWEADGGEALRLRIAGEGPWLEELTRRVQALELRRVEVLGPLSRPELRQAIRRARFSVLPSEWYENGPMSVLESLACGCPVVGTRIGGIPEQIKEGEDGVLVPPRDAEGLLAGLQEAAELGPEARLEARRHAERSASRPAHMRRLMKILEEAAGQRPERGRPA
jgi:glycosyltransferase involved in cell wall biosynthesis